ncbi:hypothetical protein Hanom_Chr12g01169571 [Helianthus anomalus]
MFLWLTPCIKSGLHLRWKEGCHIFYWLTHLRRSVPGTYSAFIVHIIIHFKKKYEMVFVYFAKIGFFPIFPGCNKRFSNIF